jgi:hypothetical protein
MLKAFEKEIPVKFDKKTRAATERKALIDLFFTTPSTFYTRFQSLSGTTSPYAQQHEKAMLSFLQELSRATLAWGPYVLTYNDLKDGLILDGLATIVQSSTADTIENTPYKILTKLDRKSFIQYVHEFKLGLGLNKKTPYNRNDLENRILNLITSAQNS